MNEIAPSDSLTPGRPLPFPGDWLHAAPGKVENALNRLNIEDQARCFLAFSGKDRQNLLLLSHNPFELVRALPDEEIYQTVKEIGPEDAYPLLSVLSPPQVQLFFDLEWWGGDKFLPERAWNWVEWMDQANDIHLINWFMSEEFEQKVMFLQAFVKVYKRDEMTDQYEKVGDKAPWSPDGVYDLFFTEEETVPLLKRVFLQLYSENGPLFRALMEGVIWYPITPTVERAWQWRLSRTAEKGLADFEEAQSVYSRLEVKSISEAPPAPSEFEAEPGRRTLAPRYPLNAADPDSFLGQCFVRLKDHPRSDAIGWELVILANKVLVADRLDLGSLEARRTTLRKVLGYINIGLELGAQGEPALGEKLLSRTWMQSLFQVGYAAVMQLKWDMEQLLREQGPLVRQVLNPVLQDHLAAMIDRFPRIGVHTVTQDLEENPEIQWRHLESVVDLERLRLLERQVRFRARFVNMALGVSAADVEQLRESCRYPSRLEDFDAVCLTLTALAQYALFGQVALEALSEDAARSFLQVIFLPSPVPGEPRALNDDVLQTFRTRLEERPLAWTEADREEFVHLIREVEDTLYQEFERLNAARTVEWQFTKGLCIQ